MTRKARAVGEMAAVTGTGIIDAEARAIVNKAKTPAALLVKAVNAGAKKVLAEKMIQMLQSEKVRGAEGATAGAGGLVPRATPVPINNNNAVTSNGHSNGCF